jgi:uncharacterized protein YndB with AHSA1/START domain
MPAPTRSPEHGPNDDFVATREFKAPRALVFEVWTVSEHFARWFGPHAAEIAFCTIDPRPGGVIHFRHDFADGTKLWVKGAFDEVVPDERLVFTGGFVDAEGRPGKHPMLPDWPLDAAFETTVLFSDTALGTSVTVRQRVKPAEAAASAAVMEERRLARQGWVEVLDRLGAHLAAQLGRV